MAVCLRTNGEFTVKVLKFHMGGDPPLECHSNIIGWLAPEQITIKELDLHGVDMKNIADPVIVINIPPTTNQPWSECLLLTPHQLATAIELLVSRHGRACVTAHNI